MAGIPQRRVCLIPPSPHPLLSWGSRANKALRRESLSRHAKAQAEIPQREGSTLEGTAKTIQEEGGRDTKEGEEAWDLSASVHMVQE